MSELMTSSVVTDADVQESAQRVAGLRTAADLDGLSPVESDRETAMIENTSDRDPFIHLMGMLSDGQSGYIEGMEAQGQRHVVTSEVLPVEAPWDALEALGFKRGEPVAGDELFCRATLPEGWKKQGSDHAMWSYVVDQYGRRRVAVFYKAAFYDRRAFARLETPEGYVRSVVHGDQKLILDAAWATREHVIGIATVLAAKADEEAAEYEADEHMREFAPECRQRAAKFRTVVAKVAEVSP